MSVIAGPAAVGLGSGIAHAQPGPPSGFVGLPDSAVNADLPTGMPDHAKKKIPEVAKLRGSVMTNTGADTLEVTVSTQARAQGKLPDCQMPPQTPAYKKHCQEPTPALVLTDDVTHDGRDIALPAAAIEESLGFVPPLAYGVHEDGSTWTAPITRQGSVLVFHVPRFSSNTVTFTGSVTVTATNAGDGSQYTYSLNSVDSVTDPSVNWTGSLATEWDNESATIGAPSATHDTAAELGNGNTPSGVSISGSGSSAVVDLSPVESGSPDTFSAGSSQSWTVPAGVTSTTIKVWGAGGGGGEGSTIGDHGTDGGNGGYAEGILSVAGGDTFTVHVASGGNAGDNGRTGGSGWYTGGDGAGGDTFAGDGGGGGGASVVIRDSDAAQIAIADGGAGGKGADHSSNGDNGGNGGGGARGGTGANDGGGTGDGGDANGGAGGASVHGDLSSTTTTTGGGNAGGAGASPSGDNRGDADDGADAQVEFSWSGGTGTVEYTSAEFRVEQSTSATVDLKTVSGSTATITVESYTGSGWTQEDQITGITTSGQKSLSWSTSNDKVRVKVTASPDSGTPNVEIESIDVSGNADQSVSPAGNTDLAGPSANNEPEVTVTGHADDAGNTPSNVQLTIDGTTYDFGNVGDGATSTLETPALDPSSSTLEWSFSDGYLDYTAKFQERSKTVEPKLEINGQWVNSTQTLGAGETDNLTGNSTWITTGTNRLNLSLGSVTADAPTPKATFNFSHDSTDIISVQATEEQWSERYDVSKTYGDNTENAQFSVDFNDNSVVSVRSVEKQVNAGTKTTVSSSDYSLDGTTLTVDLGSLSSGDEVEVWAVGSKIQADNGAEITVDQATSPGDPLATEFTIDSWAGGAHLGVGGTEDGDRVHYLTNSSWEDQAYAQFDSDGSQDLYLPQAAAGEDATVGTVPISVSFPSNGDVEIHDPTDGAEPSFKVEQGDILDDDVKYTFESAKPTQKYILWSKTHELVLDQGTAQSPITLSDDDSIETLQFQEDSGGSGGGGGGGGGGGVVLKGAGASSDPLDSVPIVVFAAVIAVFGVGFVTRRFVSEKRSTILGVMGLTSLVVILIVGEAFNPGVVLAPIGENLGSVTPALALLFGGLAAWYLYRRFIKGQEPRPIQIVTNQVRRNNDD